MLGAAEATIAPVKEAFTDLMRHQAVLLDQSTGPLTSEQEAMLVTFVERGGGLICIGNGVSAYHEYDQLASVLGFPHGFCTPTTEIIARVVESDHYLTRRVDPSFSVFESVYLLEYIAADSQILWQTIWHYTPYILAYTRTYGRGRVFCTTLGSTTETREHPAFQQMIGRASRFVAGATPEEKPLQVAMIGYGAIGFEHGSAIKNVPGLSFALVCDRNEERLALARSTFQGIRTCTDTTEVANDSSIDLVIVSTPPNTHAAISMQMLRAGKHVVSEKPFCLTAAEADEMIVLAEAKQCVLTVYQCRRWDPDYLAIQQVLKSGTIGPIFYMETFIGGYSHPCHYWHSHEPISGGLFYDWGSHYLDWMLQLIPDRVVCVRGTEHKRVWHDVTNADQASIYLRFAGGQEAIFTHSDIAAAVKPKWYILGERGAIVGNWRHEVIKTRSWSGDLVEQHLALAEAQPELFVYTRDSHGVIHEQHLVLPESPEYAFHRNLANHLHSGEPLAVLPTESRRTTAVLEAAKRSAEQGGEAITLAY